MSGNTFLFVCLLIVNFSFIVCVDINGQNETVSYRCGLNDSELITDGKLLPNDSIVYNNILYNRDQYFFLNVSGSEQKRGCPCLVRSCIQLCCPLGKAGYPGCVETNHTFEMPIYEDTTPADGYIIDHKYFNNSCIKHRETGFYLQKNGSLLINESKIPTIYTRDEYCIDFVELPEEVEGMKYRIDALLCFPEQILDEAHENKIKILSRVMLISVPFLVATLVVYCILPELHNLHGYIMITYLSCFTIFFIFLVALQISTGEYQIDHNDCLFLDFAVYFSSMVSFFWMNVMCFDIWWTFSGQRTWREIGRAGIKKRYMLYSIYAWVIPTLLTCFLAYMQFNEDLSDDYITPGFGLKSCWFKDKTSQFMYMYLPIGILLACNVVLFSTTTYRIFTISRETRMLQENQGKKKTFEKERQRLLRPEEIKRYIVEEEENSINGLDKIFDNVVIKKSDNNSFNEHSLVGSEDEGSEEDPLQHIGLEGTGFFLYLKLFTVMGLNWILEIVSFLFYNESESWMVTDVFNCLIGVLIFIIFVLKKKILKLLMKRYMPCFGDALMKQTETSSTLPSSLDNSIGMNPTNLRKSSSNSTTNTET